MKRNVFLIVFGLIVVLSGFSSGSKEKESIGSPEVSSGGSPEGGIDMLADRSDGEMFAKRILVYTTIEEARMKAETGPVLLLFSASWCATCRLAIAEIGTRQEELGSITVFVVDYDGERALKQRYSVTTQHTFVQIDANGEAVVLWNGGGVDMILKNVTGLETG